MTRPELYRVGLAHGGPMDGGMIACERDAVEGGHNTTVQIAPYSRPVTVRAAYYWLEGAWHHAPGDTQVLG